MVRESAREKCTVRPRKKPRGHARSGIAPKGAEPRAGLIPAGEPTDSGLSPSAAWRWLRFWEEIEAASWVEGLAQFWTAVTEAARGVSLIPAIRELERVYVAFAPRFGLAGKPPPVITIQHRGRRKGTRGWHAADAWCRGISSETAAAPPERVHEIAVAAETLAEGVLDVATTLLHEMVHHACRLDGVRDRSGKDGEYHNKAFLDRARAAGMSFPAGKPEKRYGYRDVQLGVELRGEIAALSLDASAFTLARDTLQPTQKTPTHSVKYLCSCDPPHIIRWNRRSEPFVGLCGHLLQRMISTEIFAKAMATAGFKLEEMPRPSRSPSRSTSAPTSGLTPKMPHKAAVDTVEQSSMVGG